MTVYIYINSSAKIKVEKLVTIKHQLSSPEYTTREQFFHISEILSVNCSAGQPCNYAQSTLGQKKKGIIFGSTGLHGASETYSHYQ